jgi:oxygen-independent coproporphyrinogen-3 oxidase
MAGIYIHIPFCKKACHYCNFHFSTSQHRIPDMLKAICREAELQKTYINDKIETIYFGGGTPSLISSTEIQMVIDRIRQLYEVSSDAEISIEANPDDITEEKLTGWKKAGINRLSIGIQSFFEEDLQWMNRAHTAEQALQCIAYAKNIGIHNISIDLIYGTPTLTDEKWARNVAIALSLEVPHLSCYALTVESKTALAKMIAMHSKENIDVEKQARHFFQLQQWISEAGYEAYEISNYSLPGYRSRHNSSYWQGKTYLGLGPSAHSFNGSSRQWNISNNSLYLQKLEEGILPFDIEILTKTQQLNEYIMTSLRTIEGIALNTVTENWGASTELELMKTAQKHIERNHLIVKNNYLQLTLSAKFLADGIAADLFGED